MEIACPRCKKSSIRHYAARSIHDGYTQICTGCAAKEQNEREGIDPPYTGKPYWREDIKIVRGGRA